MDEILPPTRSATAVGGSSSSTSTRWLTLSSTTTSELLTDVLRVLVDSKLLCYFCILLTSTRALKVLQLPTSSQIGHTSISLPLLKIDHMYKVVQHITRLCCARVADASAPVAPGAIVKLMLSGDEDRAVKLQTASELRCFTYLLELLAGVPRFLEKALFEMGCESSSRVFRPEIFLRNVERVHDSTFVFGELLRAVVDAITTKYDRFLNHLRSLEVFPLLVTCSLFGARFYRSQIIQHGPRVNEAFKADVHYIADLEDDGVIFLTEPQSSGQSQRHRLPLAPPRDAAWSQSLLAPAAVADRSRCNGTTRSSASSSLSSGCTSWSRAQLSTPAPSRLPCLKFNSCHSWVRPSRRPRRSGCRYLCWRSACTFWLSATRRDTERRCAFR